MTTRVLSGFVGTGVGVGVVVVGDVVVGDVVVVVGCCGVDCT